VLKFVTNGGMNLNYLKVTEAIPVNVPDWASKSISVYPNPSGTGIYTVLVPEPGNLLITNINGKVIYSKPLKIGKSSIDLSGKPAGIYIASLSTKERVYQFKLICN
jgi:hypothetical protein